MGLIGMCRPIGCGVLGGGGWWGDSENVTGLKFEGRTPI